MTCSTVCFAILPSRFVSKSNIQPGPIHGGQVTQRVGILLAILACGIAFAVIGFQADRVFGYEFQAAIAYNAQKVPQATTPVTPYFPVLLAILTGSPWLTAVFCISFIAWI